MAKVFISYGNVSPDRELAKDIAGALAERGYEPFLDVISISIGEQWAEKIQHSLEEADIYVVLLSEKSVHSANVQREIEHALARRSADPKIRILPVRVAYSGPLPPILVPLQHAVWEKPSDTQRIITQIIKAIAPPVSQQESPPPAGKPELTREAAAAVPALERLSDIDVATFLARLAYESPSDLALAETPTLDALGAALQRRNRSPRELAAVAAELKKTNPDFTPDRLWLAWVQTAHRRFFTDLPAWQQRAATSASAERPAVPSIPTYSKAPSKITKYVIPSSPISPRRWDQPPQQMPPPPA